MLRTGLVAGVKPRDRFLGMFTRGEAQLAMTQLTCATYRADQASSAWSVMVDTLTTIEGESRRSRALPATNHKPPGGCHLRSRSAPFERGQPVLILSP